MMKQIFNFDFKSALKRLFGDEAKAEVVVRHADTLQAAAEKEAELELPVILTIWTIERKRYASARALCTDIEVYPSAAISLCEGINAFLLGTPNGESVVVEARTGGLIGHSVEILMDSIRDMTPGQLLNQIDSAKKEFNRMKKHEMPNDEFWKAIQMGTEEVDAPQEY